MGIAERRRRTALREHHYGGNSQSPQCNLKVGDIVLIEADTSRATWPLGKITEILTDKIGTVRLVKVLSKGNTILRTINKLIPLEISDEVEISHEFGEQKINREAA